MNAAAGVLFWCTQTEAQARRQEPEGDKRHPLFLRFLKRSLAVNWDLVQGRNAKELDAGLHK